jgi:hypothetical protein
MSGNKKSMILFIAGMILTACQTVKIPAAYNFTVKETQRNPYGCWTIMTLNSPKDTLVQNSIAGELICMDSDTIYLLELDRLVRPISSGSVRKAELITHKNQAGNYALRTSLFLVPGIIGALAYASDYGGDFLLTGIPVALIGFSQALAEGSSHRNIL